MNKDYYLGLRNRYVPSSIKIVFVLESPPISGKYFYDETGSVSEPLFAAMMKIFDFTPRNKQEGLKYFADFGNLLIDATYEPVNHLKGTSRDNTILKSYDDLMADLRTLGDPTQFNIILVKANVCRLLEYRLLTDGFKVKNKGVVIPFPSTGQQTNFYREIMQVMETTNNYNVPIDQNELPITMKLTIGKGYSEVFKPGTKHEFVLGLLKRGPKKMVYLLVP